MRRRPSTARLGSSVTLPNKKEVAVEVPEVGTETKKKEIPPITAEPEEKKELPIISEPKPEKTMKAQATPELKFDINKAERVEVKK